MNPLAGVRVVSMALNLPGPAACARLRDLGATIVKVEPPGGDPFASLCPAWYTRLHAGLEVRSLDLKEAHGRAALEGLLASADIFVTAQRPAALARLALDATALALRHPRLCHVAITGHAPPHAEQPGHDLTYLAEHGLVDPPALPRTLFADMAGAERTISTALALLHSRHRTGSGGVAYVALAEAAACLAQPLVAGLTVPGAMLGGGLPGYNLYRATDRWIAVAALEPHFARRLAEALGMAALTVEALRERFATRRADDWIAWAREHDLPLIAVSSPEPC